MKWKHSAKKVNSNWWDRMSPGVTPTPARENQSSFGFFPLGHLEASRLTPRTSARFLLLPLVLESKPVFFSGWLISKIWWKYVLVQHTFKLSLNLTVRPDRKCFQFSKGTFVLRPISRGYGSQLLGFLLDVKWCVSPRDCFLSCCFPQPSPLFHFHGFLIQGWFCPPLFADFGLSNCAGILGHSDPFSTQCGSPAYAAPELLARKKYGPKIDVWSMWVIELLRLNAPSCCLRCSLLMK